MWLKMLYTHNLLWKYPLLPTHIQFGFDANIRTITHTFTPPNNLSIPMHAAAFATVVENEFKSGRYLGPFTKTEMERLIGPFQTSPVSMVPKTGKLGQFRIVQNLSYPHTPTKNVSSINHTIDSDLFPSTWGTFTTISLLIWQLLPGSQAAVRDVAAMYRSIPIIPSQWPGLVVHLKESNLFAIDTNDCFGLSSGGGIYGEVGDAGADLFRAHGLGPVLKWVDNHIFFQIPTHHLPMYNNLCLLLHAQITQNGGLQ